MPVYRGANWMERECYDMFGIASTATRTCAASCWAMTGSGIPF